MTPGPQTSNTHVPHTTLTLSLILPSFTPKKQHHPQRPFSRVFFRKDPTIPRPHFFLKKKNKFPSKFSGQKPPKQHTDTQITHIPGHTFSGWWLNQPIWKILVKLDHFPNFRVENKQSLKPTPRWWLSIIPKSSSPKSLVFYLFSKPPPSFLSVFSKENKPPRPKPRQNRACHGVCRLRFRSSLHFEGSKLSLPTICRTKKGQETHPTNAGLEASFNMYTPPKFNMEPAENDGLNQKESVFFQGLIFFRFHVKLQGCKLYPKWTPM